MNCMELDIDFVSYSWVIGDLIFSEISDEVCMDEFPLKIIIIISFRENPHVGENDRVNSDVVDVVEIADCLVDWECVYHYNKIGEVFIIIYYALFDNYRFSYDRIYMKTWC